MDWLTFLFGPSISVLNEEQCVGVSNSRPVTWVQPDKGSNPDHQMYLESVFDIKNQLIGHNQIEQIEYLKNPLGAKWSTNLGVGVGGGGGTYTFTTFISLLLYLFNINADFCVIVLLSWFPHDVGLYVIKNLFDPADIERLLIVISLCDQQYWY